MILNISLELPVENPVLIFALVLIIMLLSPVLLHRLRIPGIVGLIMAGVIVGPYGLNILDRGDEFELFGTIGLLYLMFLVGLEVDLIDLSV